MAITLLTPINPICFVSELALLTISAPGETSIKFEISQGGLAIFSNEYYPDADGIVNIYDLDKFVAHYLLDDNYDNNRFYFTVNDVHVVNYVNVHDPSCKVIPCTVAVSECAATFIPDFFLTPVMHERNTAVGRYETLTAITSENTQVLVSANYYNQSTQKVVTNLIGLTYLLGWATLNVSPERFVDESKGRLIGYTVQCGKRKAHYRVLASMPEADPALLFRNCFGAWETIYLTGAKAQEPSYTRSSAMVNGCYMTYDIEETMSWKAYTGPMRNGMVALANDLARSKSVFLLAKDGSTADEIVITDQDVKTDNADNTIPDFQFTYRRASRNTSKLEVKRPPRIFDKTFDKKFE